MSIPIELTAQEIAALKRVTKLENDGEAVAKAAREFLRLSRLRELKAVSGKIEWEDNWQELEEREAASRLFASYTSVDKSDVPRSPREGPTDEYASPRHAAPRG